MAEYVHHNIFELATPIGSVVITDSMKRIPFSVENNSFSFPYEIYDSRNETVIGTIHTETNFNIVIDTRLLKEGEECRITFSTGNLGYCDSDEHTESLSVTHNGWSFGMGMYDPNDDEKLRQAEAYSKKVGAGGEGLIVPPPSYDRKLFHGYDVERMKDGTGYRFQLLDQTLTEIRFPVAWIENRGSSIADCEAALGYWLT